MANTVDKVIKIATAEVGYLEKKSNKNLDSKVENAGSNNYTKYGRDMHKICPSVMDFPAPWCDAFVDWCFYKAYGLTTAKKLLCGGFNDYTVASAQMYKNKKAWHSSKPQVGDQIFFQDSGGICHTGLVYQVDSHYVYTIEGNTSGGSGVVKNGGGVFKKFYTLNNSRIAGYGRPKYDTPKTAAQTNTKKIPPLAACTPNLKSGSKGTQVKYLQQDLNYVLGCKLIVDGIFGSNTRKQLETFQKKNILTADGIYGSKTHSKMKAKLK